MSDPGRRFLVIGNPGTGKSTLGLRLAAEFDLPYFDVDELFWRPGWEQTPEPVLRQLVDSATVDDRWVFAGDFASIADITWPRASTVVFLDYSIPVVVGRLLRRSVRRRRGLEAVPAGNREAWYRYLHPRRSPVRPALRVKNGIRRLFEEQQADPRLAHVEFVRLRSPRESEQWLQAMKPARATPERPRRRAYA